jgi:epidermal growth factor receptor substrate 15
VIIYQLTTINLIDEYIVVPLPQFDGVAPSPIISNNTPLLSTPSISSNASSITNAECEKYANIFKVHQPINGVLDANTAKSVFLKSKLPMDTLSQIW